MDQDLLIANKKEEKSNESNFFNEENPLNLEKSSASITKTNTLERINSLALENLNNFIREQEKENIDESQRNSSRKQSKISDEEEIIIDDDKTIKENNNQNDIHEIFKNSQNDYYFKSNLNKSDSSGNDKIVNDDENFNKTIRNKKIKRNSLNNSKNFEEKNKENIYNYLNSKIKFSKEIENEISNKDKKGIGKINFFQDTNSKLSLGNKFKMSERLDKSPKNTNIKGDSLLIFNKENNNEKINSFSFISDIMRIQKSPEKTVSNFRNTINTSSILENINSTPLNLNASSEKSIEFSWSEKYNSPNMLDKNNPLHKSRENSKEDFINNFTNVNETNNFSRTFEINKKLPKQNNLQSFSLSSFNNFSRKSEVKSLSKQINNSNYVNKKIKNPTVNLSSIRSKNSKNEKENNFHVAENKNEIVSLKNKRKEMLLKSSKFTCDKDKKILIYHDLFVDEYRKNKLKKEEKKSNFNVSNILNEFESNFSKKKETFTIEEKENFEEKKVQKNPEKENFGEIIDLIGNENNKQGIFVPINKNYISCKKCNLIINCEGKNKFIISN